MIFSFSELLESLFLGSVGRTKKIKPKSQFYFFWVKIKILLVGRWKKKTKKKKTIGTVPSVNCPFKTELTIMSVFAEVGGAGGLDLPFTLVGMKVDIAK